MDLEEIRLALEGALDLKPPRWGPDEQPRRKIAAIEEHLVASAGVNATLVAARHWLRELRYVLSQQWAALEGFEVALPTNKPRAKITAADVERAKVRFSPQLYEAGREARRLAESVDDQITRLEREERVMSRLFSLIVGN